MKVLRWILATAAVTATSLPVQAQMMSTTQMGGGSYTANLVSAPSADTQIGRGMVMITQAMPGIRGMPMGNYGTGGNARGLRVQLILTGVTSPNALVTSTGNVLTVSGSLTSAGGTSQPVSVKQSFDINGGTAILWVPITLSSFMLPATLQIDNVEVADKKGQTFGVTGLRMSTTTRPPVTMPPGMGNPTMTPPHMDPTVTRTPGRGMM